MVPGAGGMMDLQYFGQFHVGMATQHGYYLSYGDFVHPDRKEWQAMPTDAAGPVTMTLEKIKARVFPGALDQKTGFPAADLHFHGITIAEDLREGQGFPGRKGNGPRSRDEIERLERKRPRNFQP